MERLKRRVLVVFRQRITLERVIQEEIDVVLAPKAIVEALEKDGLCFNGHRRPIQFMSTDDFLPGLDFCDGFKNWFKNFCLVNGLPDLEGFCNPIFESSVRPLYSYFLGLSSIVREYESNIVVLHDGICSGFGSTYYMAEWERSTRLLYQRELWFASYIEAYCGSFKVPVSSIHSRIRVRFFYFCKRRLYQFVRRELLTLIKLLQSCKRFFARQRQGVSFGQVPDTAGLHYVFLSRTVPQSFFFKNIVGKLDKPSIILGFESFSFFGRNRRYIRSEYDRSFDLSGGVDELAYLRTHLFCLWHRIFLLRECRFTDCLFFIDLRFAIAEALTLTPDLVTYKHLLVKKLSYINKAESFKIISGEYKSQSAFIEHQVASEFNADYIQFIECDHKADMIPVPHLGSPVFVNSKQMVDDFTAAYGGDKFLYIGDPRYQVSDSCAHSPVSKFIVFLTTPNKYDECLAIARALVDTKKTDQALRIKKHPRDQNAYSEFVGREDIEVCDGDISLDTALDKAALVVSFNTTAALVVLGRGLSLVICRFSADDEYELPYIAPDESNLARSIAEMIEIMLDEESLRKSCDTIRLQQLSAYCVEGDDLIRRFEKAVAR